MTPDWINGFAAGVFVCLVIAVGVSITVIVIRERRSDQ